jgi:cytochrome c556
MRRKIILLSSIAIAIGVAGAFALDALKPGSESPAQVVLVRKAAMQSNAIAFGDIKAKSSAGNVKAISANARGMAVTGAVLPLLFKDQSRDSYPAGYKFFFKGGSLDDFTVKAQAFSDAAGALALAAEKGDAAALDSPVNSLSASCGACHAAYRGSM